MENERETLILKHEIHRRRNGWVKVFGRKKKEKDTVGVACPYCEYNNPIGSTTCEQCYYELDKSARNQPMATPTTSGDEIMSMLLAENEDDEEEGVQVVEAVLSMDEITVEVDQYSLGQPTHDEDGEPQPESFEFIGSEGPTLSETVASVEDDEPTELKTRQNSTLSLNLKPWIHSQKSLNPCTLEKEGCTLPPYQQPTTMTFSAMSALHPPMPRRTFLTSLMIHLHPRRWLKPLLWKQRHHLQHRSSLNCQGKKRQSPKQRPLKNLKPPLFKTTGFGPGQRPNLGLQLRSIRKWSQRWNTSSTGVWNRLQALLTGSALTST
jgi:hypothetical protein